MGRVAFMDIFASSITIHPTVQVAFVSLFGLVFATLWQSYTTKKENRKDHGETVAAVREFQRVANDLRAEVLEVKDIALDSIDVAQHNRADLQRIQSRITSLEEKIT